MPCLNEAETLARCVQKAQDALRASGIKGEVIIADNGSTDGSQQIAESMGARVVTVHEKGYGSALKGGINAAQGTYILMGDADDSYDFGQLDRFVTELDSGADLVMGNRFQGGIAPGAMPLLHRYLGNPVLSKIGRVLFNSKIGDFHCGLRAFRKEAFDSLHLQSPGMEFASEMVVRAALLGFRVSEVPTTLAKDGRSRPPHLRTWRDGWRHLRFLLLYSPKWLFLFPGAALMLLGSIVFFSLLGGPMKISGITFDVNTMMYGAAAVLVGFQAVVFAMFAKILGVTQGLLPQNKTLDSLFQWINLEVGVAVGVVLTLVGLAVSAGAVLSWKHTGFGPLEVTHTVRTVSLGILFLTLGVEVFFSSFFFSVIGYVKKHE
jgi:glycosyltransferase involved in cell wall biosynthesis